MNMVDIFVLVIVALGVITGLRSGLIRQVLGFAGLIAAFVFGVIFMDNVGAAISGRFGMPEDLAPLVGFALVFVAVEVGVFLIVRLVTAVIGVLHLTIVNRALGGVLGAFKAGLVLSILFYLMGYIGLPSVSAQSESMFYAPVSTIMPSAWNFVTDTFPQVVELSDRFGAMDSGL